MMRGEEKNEMKSSNRKTFVGTSATTGIFAAKLAFSLARAGKNKHKLDRLV